MAFVAILSLSHCLAQPSLFSPSMIDLHCHILPGIDDGAQIWEDSIAMAKQAAADGIQIIAATPHLGDPTLSPQLIHQLTEQLNQLLLENHIPVRVIAGAEFPCHLDTALAASYCLKNTSCLMVEFPHSHFPSMAFAFLGRLTSMGIRPCIVHPERNLEIQHEPKLMTRLRNEYGVMFQVTAGSLCGDWGMEARLCANFLVRNMLCDLIASDSHSPEWRPPLLSKAVNIAAKLSNHEISQAMVHATPLAILQERGVA